MLRPTVQVPDLDTLFDGTEDQIAQFMTEAMGDATAGLKGGLRDQVRSSGLGARLANTIRGNTYPQSGASMEPAGYVWSKAPAIIDAFNRGATIAPHGGRKYLWLPTKRVPRAPAQGRATSQKRMTAPQVEASFRQRLLVRPGKGGNKLAFLVQKRGTTPTGRIRKVRKGRLGYGDAAELVLMFVLVPTVKLPKKLDLEGEAQHWAAQFPTLLAARWR